MREVLERLRPGLRTFRDERGRELFDVPDGPLPAGDTPAPVRFLPEYDNAFLAHADRSRVVLSGMPPWTDVGWGPVLVDGFVAARWRLVGEADETVLRVEPFRPLTEDAEVEEERARLAAFLEATTRWVGSVPSMGGRCSVACLPRSSGTMRATPLTRRRVCLYVPRYGSTNLVGPISERRIPRGGGRGSRSAC
ncbi:MAG TPA: crosslink repair DNA glycosylase YcaQ family protein [Actinomycetota bacterium]|nr:crosslink repair DNA glycosylase YcaQ family protein [Actinomycetota bacterium]